MCTCYILQNSELSIFCLWHQKSSFYIDKYMYIKGKNSWCFDTSLNQKDLYNTKYVFISSKKEQKLKD